MLTPISAQVSRSIEPRVSPFSDRLDRLCWTYTDTPLAPQVEIAEVYFAKGMWLVYRPVGMSSGPAINDFWREQPFGLTIG